MSANLIWVATLTFLWLLESCSPTPQVWDVYSSSSSSSKPVSDTQTAADTLATKRSYPRVGYGWIKGNSVNIRDKPSKDSKVLFKASQGLEFKLIEKEGDWWKIVWGISKYAYVHSDFISQSPFTINPGKNIDTYLQTPKEAIDELWVRIMSATDMYGVLKYRTNTYLPYPYMSDVFQGLSLPGKHLVRIEVRTNLWCFNTDLYWPMERDNIVREWFALWTLSLANNGAEPSLAILYVESDSFHKPLAWLGFVHWNSEVEGRLFVKHFEYLP